MAIAAAAASAKKASIANLQPGAGGALLQMENAYKTWKGDSGFTDGANLRRTISAMRQIKTPAEIALIKKAAEISARAHVEALRSAQPGMREWEIGALVQYIFAKEGCEYTGYPPICGSGPNSTILHYDSNRRLMQSGDMMCMDTAGEYHGYSADVTRSFPINGKFTPEQRAVYQIVYDAQSTGIDMCRSGASVGAIEQKIRQVLSAGLIKLGIIKSANELGTYYMHGFGHGIGLDVHDPLPGTLAPGAILTVEPGIYIKSGSPCDKKWWNIGVRIEDDILVTDGAPVNLSAGAPRTADAIEKLMAETGIGNMKQAPLKAGG
jgi:Xaa-Pro aminopeptidase